MVIWVRHLAVDRNRLSSSLGWMSTTHDEHDMLPISPFSLACLLLGPALSIARPHELGSNAQATFGPPASTEVELGTGEDDRWSPLARKYAPIIYLA